MAASTTGKNGKLERPDVIETEEEKLLKQKQSLTQTGSSVTETSSLSDSVPAIDFKKEDILSFIPNVSFSVDVKLDSSFSLPSIKDIPLPSFNPDLGSLVPDFKLPEFSMEDFALDFDLSLDLSIPSLAIPNLTDAFTLGNLGFGSLTSALDATKTGGTLLKPTEELNQGGFIEVRYKDSKGKELLEGINHIEIEESIDNLYRTGKMVIEERLGFTDLTNITNTFDDEYVEIRLQNRFEEDNVFKEIKFGLHDMQDDPNNNRTVFNLKEEPFFSQYHRKALIKGYNGLPAQDIIADILKNEMGVQAIKQYGDNNTVLPHFICPNRDAAACIKYLAPYTMHGPLKVFNTTISTETVTHIAPLEKVMRGQVFPDQVINMFPTPTTLIKGGIRMTDWILFGPRNEALMSGKQRGEARITFSHVDSNEKVEFKTHEGAKNAKVEKPETPSSATTITQEYKDAIKSETVTDNLGEFATQRKELFSQPNQRIEIDSDESFLAAAKMRSRFRSSYHNNLMLKVILPGLAVINVGMIFDIVIPQQVMQEDKNTMLSGKWLLHTIKHVITRSDGGPTKNGVKEGIISSKLGYNIVGYFCRSGYSLPLETSDSPSVNDTST